MFYVQLFTVHFVGLKMYEIKVHFVGLKMYKIKVHFVRLNMYKNLMNLNWKHCIDQMKINFQTGPCDTL